VDFPAEALKAQTPYREETVKFTVSIGGQ